MIAVEMSGRISEIEEEPEPESSFMQQAYAIGYVLWLGDLWEYLKAMLDKLQGKPIPSVNYEEDDWKPDPTAIPFGPFLSVGFLLTVFVGELLTNLYLTRVLHWN